MSFRFVAKRGLLALCNPWEPILSVFNLDPQPNVWSFFEKHVKMQNSETLDQRTLKTN